VEACSSRDAASNVSSPNYILICAVYCWLLFELLQLVYC